jgi:hypothetical protein
LKRLMYVAVLSAVFVLVFAVVAWAQPWAPESSEEQGTWEWTDWQQWEGSPWWCSSGWFHSEENGWDLKAMFCYDTETGEVWNWP